MAKIDSLRVLLEEFESRFVAGLSEESVLKLIEDVTNRLKFSIVVKDVEGERGGGHLSARFVKIDTKPGVIDGVTYYPLFAGQKTTVPVYTVNNASNYDEAVDFHIRLVRGNNVTGSLNQAWHKDYGSDVVREALAKLFDKAESDIHWAIEKDNRKRHPEHYEIGMY